jgi:hypothetical protein
LIETGKKNDHAFAVVPIVGINGSASDCGVDRENVEAILARAEDERRPLELV